MTLAEPMEPQRSAAVRAAPDRERVLSPDGVLPIDKPVGMTSHDVVDVVRRLYRTRRVGHTGTLDPAASGLLLIVMGGATRVAPYLSAQDKTYLATVRFGATSDTGDAEGRIVPLAVTRDEPRSDVPLPDRGHLEELLPRLEGSISLDIPAYAAVRTQGRRRYDLARSGQPVPAAERVVTIHEMTLLRYDPPDAEIRVRCSTGTYIRSLAAALGETAGCGAYLGALRREGIRKCQVTEALSLDALERLANAGQPLPKPRPIEEFLTLPGIDIAPTSVEVVRHGQPIRAVNISSVDGAFHTGDVVALRNDSGHIVAFGCALFDSDQWPDHLPSDNEPLFRYQRVLV
jgi:tRNA pseudouridine55 synthase